MQLTTTAHYCNSVLQLTTATHYFSSKLQLIDESPTDTGNRASSLMELNGTPRQNSLHRRFTISTQVICSWKCALSHIKRRGITFSAIVAVDNSNSGHQTSPKLGTSRIKIIIFMSNMESLPTIHRSVPKRTMFLLQKMLPLKKRTTSSRRRVGNWQLQGYLPVWRRVGRVSNCFEIFLIWLIFFVEF